MALVQRHRFKMKRTSNQPLKNPGRPENWFFLSLAATFILGSSVYINNTRNEKAGILLGLAGASTVLFVYRLAVRDYKECLFWERVDLRRTRAEQNGETFNGPKTWHDWNGLKGGHGRPYN